MKVFIKPAADLTIMHPEKRGEPIPKEGIEVELNTTWQRMINSGDVKVAHQRKSSGGDKSQGEDE